MIRPKISAVITCLNEESTIDVFITSLHKALGRLKVDFEIILVNDGSSDGTFGVICRLFESFPEITVALNLMRNSGQAAAITAGLTEARGCYILMMDSDLQLQPDEVSFLWGAIQQGAQVATGYRRARRDSLMRKIPSLFANWIMRRASGTDLRDFGCTFRIVDRKLIDAFQFGAFRVLSTPLLLSRAGRITEVEVSHQPRAQGRSGWTFRKLWRYQTDNMVLLAEPVFQLVGWSSIAVTMLVLLRIVLDPWLEWHVLGRVTNGLLLNAVAGATFIVTALLCILGEFIIRCHRSAVGAPAYVVATRVHRNSSPIEPFQGAGQSPAGALE